MFFYNLTTLNILFNADSLQKLKETFSIILLIIFSIMIINHFIFVYKNRYLQIIEECKMIPVQIRKIGIVFFTLYSIISFLGLLIVIFAGWKIN